MVPVVGAKNWASKYCTSSVDKVVGRAPLTVKIQRESILVSLMNKALGVGRRSVDVSAKVADDERVAL